MSSFASTLRRVVTPETRRFGIRWATRNTPSTRNRTTSCVLLRLEVDVARALLGGLEDDRVDQSDERCLRDAVVDLEVVFLDLLDRGVGDGVLDERRVQRLGRAREAPDLGRDVSLGGDVEFDRVACGEPELVESAHVLRIGDRDLQRRAGERERQGAHALQHGERDGLARLCVDADDGEVDERQVELLGERTGDSERARHAFVDQRLREGAAERAGAHGLELVLGQQTGVADELRDELAPLPRLGSGGRRGVAAVVFARLREAQSGEVLEGSRQWAPP